MSDIARVLVEVANASRFADPHADDALAVARRLDGLDGVRLARTYELVATRDGALEAPDLDAAIRSLFADPVVERLSIDEPLVFDEGAPAEVVWIRPRRGVTDPVAESARGALRRRGLDGIDVVSGRKLLLFGRGGWTADTLRGLIEKRLANPVIEEIHVGAAAPSPHAPAGARAFARIDVPLRDLDDDALAAVEREHKLSLSLEEMQAIQAFYREADRDPTDVELLTLAQTWSEHCKHKTLRSRIEFDGEIIDGLLQQTVFKATETLARDDCLSVFADNAGVIAFDEHHGIAFKVETHNHPSAIEPYGGAGTGIGGVIRDILGTGLGAKPILNTDVFCFAHTDRDPDTLPRGTLHPATIMRGVVSGVRDYGNRMGIPTPSGALYFDDRYVGNPVVYAGCLGIIPRDKIDKAAQPGDRIIAIGGRTGRDGIGGATFSSAELTSESEVVDATSVQIGNPIMEKRVMEGLLRARDEGLYNAVTDCGAGGFSSAVGEMGEETGADVELSTAPLKYAGLSPAEIWLSEAQERMILAVPEQHVARLTEVMALEGVEVADLGRFTDDARLRITFRDEVHCDLPMAFLHDGLPKTTRTATWQAPTVEAPPIPERVDWSDTLGDILAMPNVASKEWVIRQYDHEVQAGTVVKPLQGPRCDGPGDAIVVKPLADSDKGVAVACGMNPHQGDLDPYHMAINAVDEALRNLAVVGCPPARAALLDNFSWGNPRRPEMLGALVLASKGCYDAALAYRAPFVSGKDSLNNEFAHDGETISIPHTLLISAMGVIDDVARPATIDLKAAGNALYVAGVTRAELGASHLHLLLGGRDRPAGGAIPTVDLATAPRALATAATAVEHGLVRTAHDLSEGGLAVAIAEMAFTGSVGVTLDLDAVPTDGALAAHEVLFAETPTRIAFEVAPDAVDAFEALWREAGVPCARIGDTTDGDRLVATHGGSTVLDASLDALRARWQTPLLPETGDVR